MLARYRFFNKHDRLPPSGRLSLVRRRVALRNRPRGRALRSTSTAPRRSPRGIAPSTRRSPGHPHAMHYALKANSTLAIARLLRSLGSGADANSGGEIDVALRAGFIPPQIVFTGVGKTQDELAQAIDLGVKTINVESEGELERIDAIARQRQTRARVAIRINPDIDARSHPHISTGLKTNKFGIAIDEARDVVPSHARRPGHRDRRACTPTSGRRSWTSSRCAARRRARRARARAAGRRHPHRAPRSRRRPGHLLRRHAPSRARRTTPRRLLPRRPRIGSVDHPRARPAHRGAGRRAADARRGRQGPAGRQAVRRSSTPG